MLTINRTRPHQPATEPTGDKLKINRHLRRAIPVQPRIRIPSRRGAGRHGGMSRAVSGERRQQRARSTVTTRSTSHSAEYLPKGEHFLDKPQIFQ